MDGRREFEGEGGWSKEKKHDTTPALEGCRRRLQSVCWRLSKRQASAYMYLKESENCLTVSTIGPLAVLCGHVSSENIMDVAHIPQTSHEM
jgi:hypothetical protein